MSRLSDHELYLASILKIDVSLLDINDVKKIEKYNLNVQIEINSGMNRFGITIDELKEVKNLNVVGLYSHNATMKKRYINKQLELFKSTIDTKDFDIHYQSSSLIERKIPFVNCKRIGEYLYNDSITFYGKVIRILHLKKGSYIGYNYTYKLKRDSLVAVIDIGYSDGLERRCNNFKVWIGEKFYKMIGLACMNHSFVLIDEHVKENDYVEFIGLNNKMINYVKFFKKIPHQVYLEILKCINK